MRCAVLRRSLRRQRPDLHAGATAWHAGATARRLTAARASARRARRALAALNELRDRPAGAIRITAGQHAAETILWPALQKLLPKYPDVRVEISVDQALTDIVAGRYDAGVRLGEQVEKDMIATRIGPDMRMAVVGSPSYFATHPAPKTPHDLTHHTCINLRLPTLGGLYAWEFEKDGREVNVRVDGQLVFNDMALVLKAATAGFGLACPLEDQAKQLISDGRLVRALADWCPPFPGYHLYYPSRRQMTPAFALLVEALRHRAGRPAAQARRRSVR